MTKVLHFDQYTIGTLQKYFSLRSDNISKMVFYSDKFSTFAQTYTIAEA